MEELIYEAYKESLKVGQCGMLTGRETVKEFCALIFKSQGIEYMIKHRFPSIELVRKLADKYDVTQYHVFVDKGKIKFENERRVCLFGNTQADILCTETKAYHIHLMQGATAVIHAHNYAVVAIEKDDSCRVTIDKQEHANILM